MHMPNKSIYIGENYDLQKIVGKKLLGFDYKESDEHNWKDHNVPAYDVSIKVGKLHHEHYIAGEKANPDGIE